MHDNGLQESSVGGVDDVDRARAQEYALLATLLSRSPDDRMLGCLALLRGDASPLGVAHTALAKAAAKADAESVKAEYFDLFDSLAGGQIAAPAEAGREIFETHLAPWIGRFFADLERAESASFYARVGALGRTFVEIETKAFTLPASGQVR